MVIGPHGTTLPAITSPRSSTTPLIAACSATGQVIPPFFVFAEKRSTPDLMKGALPSSDHRMSEKGWSNSVIFCNFSMSHFIHHVPQGDEYTIILYDGAKSQISPPLIEWAREKNYTFCFACPHLSYSPAARCRLLWAI